MDDQQVSKPRLFVSHHSSTFETALKVEQLLADRGIECWIAPRDVEPGEPFDKAISNAIMKSAAILLLFCEQSDKSRHVKRELILADTAGRAIIPLRLEGIGPAELAYHLADSQWIDWTDQRAVVMDRVASQAHLFAGSVPPIEGPLPQTHRSQTQSSVAQSSNSGLKKWQWAVGLLLLLATVALATWIFATWDGEENADGSVAVASAELDETGVDADSSDGTDEDGSPPLPQRRCKHLLRLPAPTQTLAQSAGLLPHLLMLLSARLPQPLHQFPPIAALLPVLSMDVAGRQPILNI